MPQTIIRINVDVDYFDELGRRMARYDITRSQLANELGINRSSVSRLFAHGATRVTLARVKDIEKAIVAIRHARKKAPK